MRVDENLLKEAVLNIYARSVYGHYDVAPEPGRYLSLSELRDEWKDCHLRCDDLDHALTALQTTGHIAMDVLDGQPHYALTARGIAAGTAGSWKSPRMFWKHLNGIVKLSASQSRRAGALNGDAPRRRSSDHARSA